MTSSPRRKGTRLTRPLIGETRLMQSYITPAGLKLIFDPRRDRVELYDLKNDPTESQNLADIEELVEPPLSELLQFMQVHRLRCGYENGAPEPGCDDGYEPPFVR